MIMAFILKLKKLEVRLIKKILTHKELQKIAQAMLDQADFSMIQSQSGMEQQQKDMETLLSTFTENIESQQDQNFSQEDNVVPKNKMKIRKDYSNTKVKTRNFLANVSYRRFKQSDLNKSVLLLAFCHFHCKISIQ